MIRLPAGSASTVTLRRGAVERIFGSVREIRRIFSRASFEFDTAKEDGIEQERDGDRDHVVGTHRALE